jgi:hypothetical protein
MGRPDHANAATKILLWHLHTRSHPWRSSLYHASIACTTSPCTSVSRKSRPWNRYVSRS